MKHKPYGGLNEWLGLGIAIAAICCLNFVSNPSVTLPTSPASSEIRGVWLTNVGSGVLFAPWGVNRAIHQLSQLNFNTVYPVVWNRGYTFYPSAVARSITGQSQDPLLTLMRFKQDVLAEIVKQGHRRDLRVIPWFEYGLMTPAHSQLAKRHPEWITQTQDHKNSEGQIPEPEQSNFQNLPHFIRNGLVTQQVWLNPIHPQVQQFLLDLILEVVTQYDVDGIQLDDHFGMPVELGYDRFTILLYQQEHQGQSPPDDYLDSEWMRWRANKLTEFMQKIFAAVKRVKPKCLVSLSPNSEDFAYRYYLQDWLNWVNQGWVDELILQVYRDNLSSFQAELAQPELQSVRSKIPVAIGILTGTWQRPVAIQQIENQVKEVRGDQRDLQENRQFDGVSFFYWESLWGYIAPEAPQERRQAFKKLFTDESR